MTRIALVVLAALIAWGIYLYGAINSPFLSNEKAAQRAYLDQVLRDAEKGSADDARLANAYWDRYPDVAEDRSFGRNGEMGVNGAREHYLRHGQREGRVWGLN